ncbi:hypothetical protein PMIN06_005738 [Paraphaeosphaeria minitans]
MYVTYSNFLAYPTPNFIYQPHQQYPAPNLPAADSAMCHYTIKFFECDHKTDDNVKGCSLWAQTGTHCDIDNPSVRKRRDCSIRSENTTGLCPRCQSRERARLLIEQEERIRVEKEQEAERARIEKEEEERRARKKWEEKEWARLDRLHEEELLRRDLEKARLADQEEQRRNAEAHEAHLRRVREDADAAWRAKNYVTETPSTTTHTRNTYTTTTVEECSPPPSPSPPPPPPAPAVPSIDYSQPLKEQKYGHHFIGTRRQPVHASQEHPLSPTPPSTPRSPQTPARRAPAAKASPQTPPSSASGFSGLSSGRPKLRARPPPKEAPQGDFGSELQAMWNRRGIKRETDEDDGITNASISPSESASRIGGGTPKGWRE